MYYDEYVMCDVMCYANVICHESMGQLCVTRMSHVMCSAYVMLCVMCYAYVICHYVMCNVMCDVLRVWLLRVFGRGPADGAAPLLPPHADGVVSCRR